MDGQFTTLLRSYHDNYVQYALTGVQSYQKAYQSALEGLDTIIASLKAEVESQKKAINDFYQSKPEKSIRDLESDTKKTKHALISKNDALTAAKLRNEVPNSTVGPSISGFYLPIGILGGLTVVLSLM
jgi:hypothetical protein